MATVVNNPGSSSDNSGVAMMLGAVAVIIALLLIIFYAVPAFTGNNTAPNTGSGTGTGNTPDTVINQDNSTPAESGGTNEMNIDVPEVDVPENIDVNVNEGQ